MPGKSATTATVRFHLPRRSPLFLYRRSLGRRAWLLHPLAAVASRLPLGADLPEGPRPAMFAILPLGAGSTCAMP